MIKAANDNAAQVGFFYLCNPNNPTGVIVPKAEVEAAVKGIPKGMPILIDEAYHHFVDDPNYAESVNYIKEGRPVIVARTFSKIAALAAMRIGYALAPAELIKQMRPYSMGSVNVLAKWGAVASLKDTAGQADVKKKITETRNKTQRELEAHGYPTIPSQANFFMVSLEGRTVQPVIQEFREKGILVGRPFPPMINHLRVSVGTPEDMDKFLKGFKEIFPKKAATTMAAPLIRIHRFNTESLNHDSQRQDAAFGRRFAFSRRACAFSAGRIPSPASARSIPSVRLRSRRP